MVAMVAYKHRTDVNKQKWGEKNCCKWFMLSSSRQRSITSNPELKIEQKLWTHHFYCCWEQLLLYWPLRICYHGIRKQLTFIDTQPRPSSGLFVTFRSHASFNTSLFLQRPTAIHCSEIKLIVKSLFMALCFTKQCLCKSTWLYFKWVQLTTERRQLVITKRKWQKDTSIRATILRQASMLKPPNLTSPERTRKEVWVINSLELWCWREYFTVQTFKDLVI